MKQIYIGGKVYTGKIPLKRIFIVEDDKFVAVSTDEEMHALKQKADTVIYLEKLLTLCYNRDDKS